MKLQLLQSKLERYLTGKAEPAETKQIQAWLSCTSQNIAISAKEKQKIKRKIRKQISKNTRRLSIAILK